MDNRNQKWGQRNIALIQLGGYIGLVAIILAAIIGLVFFGIHLANEGYEVDEASGVSVDKKNTGAISSSKLSLVGFDSLSKKYPQNAYLEMVDVLKKYFSAIRPKGTKLSYIKDSYKDNGFKVLIDNTYKYSVRAEAESQSVIKLSVRDENSLIYEYSSKTYEPPKKSASSIDSFLPYENKTIDNISYTVFRRKTDKKLEIASDNCGSKEIKDTVKDSVDRWLESNYFEPEDFQFEMPDYCDANSNK